MRRRLSLRLARRPVDRARRSRWGRRFERAISDFSRDDGQIYAAAITYYMLLALFPLAVVGVAALGLLARDQDFQARVVNQIVQQLPAGVGVRAQVEEAVEGVARPRSGVFGLVALAGAFWTASNLFGALRRALNRAFSVPSARPFIRGRVRDLVSVIVVILLAISSTALTATLAFIRAYASRWFDGVLVNIGWGLVFLAVPLGVSFSVFLLLYRLIPNHTFSWRDLWAGALVAAIGFEFSKALFSVYLATFASYQEIYGALGSLIAALVFVFIVANVTIFGAEIAAEVAEERAGRRA